MNLHTAAALAMEDVTTVEIAHFASTGGYSKNIYTYLCPPELAKKLTKDSLVAGHNKHGYFIGRVVSVHDGPDVELTEQIQYDWIFEIVQERKYTALTARHEYIVKQLKRRRQQEAVRQVLHGVNVSLLDTLSSEEGPSDHD